MRLDLQRLLSIPMTYAVDIDDQGRVLAECDASGSRQLIEIGTDGSITELTALPGACTGRYVPGSRTVIVSHDDDGNELLQLSLLHLSDEAGRPAGPSDLTPLVRDERFMHVLTLVQHGRVGLTTNRRNGVEFDAIIHDLSTGAEIVAYAGGKHIAEMALSPDGRRLAIIVAGEPANSLQLLVVDLDRPGSEPRSLTDVAEPATVAAPAWAPDGESLIVTTNLGRDFTAVARIDVVSGKLDWIIEDGEHDVSAIVSPRHDVALVEINVDGGSRLAIHDVATGERLRDVPLPAGGVAYGEPLPVPAWSPSGAAIALTISSPATLVTALRIDPAAGSAAALVDSVAELGGRRLTMPESVLIPAHDGERIPCLVYRPAVGSGAAVVWIHGGPENQSRRNYNPYVQVLVEDGYTVLVPNVRGSTGYGKRWYSLDDVRLRLDSVADLASIHAYLPELGLDQRRVALFGGSYGGYMVLAGLAFQPELWAAGVDIVGISSLVTFLENTSAYRRAVREREYGSLEHDRDFLIEASPLTRIDDIRAPLLVIHGANDPRVPLSEAEQLHAALTANGVECELLVYADEGHGLAKRVNRLDAYPRAFAFLARHLAAGD